MNTLKEINAPFEKAKNFHRQITNQELEYYGAKSINIIESVELSPGFIDGIDAPSKYTLFNVFKLLKFLVPIVLAVPESHAKYFTGDFYSLEVLYEFL